MARLRAAPSVQNAPAAARTTRQALKEKTNVTLPKAPTHKNDGNVDELVKPTKPTRGRPRRAAQNDKEVLGTSGLGRAETERQTLLSTEHPATTDELAKSDEHPHPNTTDELAKSDEQHPLLSGKPNKRPPRMTRKAVQDAAKSDVLQDVKRRMLETGDKASAAKKNLPPQVAKPLTKAAFVETKVAAPRISESSIREQSEFSLSPSPPPTDKTRAIKDRRTSLAKDESSSKVHGTPSVESSILALKNFKRRPRQPSMLQMVQQRTASARPSAVSALARGDSTVHDVLDDIVDDDDFAPDAEGTPMRLRAKSRLSAGRNKIARSVQNSPSTHVIPATTNKRKSEEADLTPSTLDALKAKRQKATRAPRSDDSAVLSNSFLPSIIPGHNLSTAAPARSPSSLRRVTSQPQATSDGQGIHSEPSTTPPTEPSSEAGANHNGGDSVVSLEEGIRHRIEPEAGNDFEDDEEDAVVNGTMAEPASSSPLSSPRQEKEPVDPTMEPQTHASPPRAKRDKRNAKKVKPITTATLQSLLPKRRQPLGPRKRISEYDIESDSDQGNPPVAGNGGAERGARSRRRTTQAKGNKALVASKSNSRQSKGAVPARKSPVAPARKSTAPPPSTRKLGKTYGRRATTASDKENEGEDAAFDSPDEIEDSILPDTSLSMYEATQSKEIEDARKKFAEVDDWDIEFESMSVEEGRSSSPNWR